jgi:hypothetical protein
MNWMGHTVCQGNSGKKAKVKEKETRRIKRAGHINVEDWFLAYLTTLFTLHILDVQV